MTDASFPLVMATKLLVPALRPETIARDRVTRRLAAASEQALTLVCAPAGYGKTTAVVAWLATVADERAWVSLDALDNDPRRLCAHLLAALDRVGLSTQVDTMAGGLTTRELRLMELARALVPHPRLMLLDETLAGLGHEDLDGILSVIRQLRADGITVLIIEHTMHAMVQLVDHFTVLDHGRLIASGRPDDVMRDPSVIEAYLGKKWMDRVAVTAK